MEIENMIEQFTHIFYELKEREDMIPETAVQTAQVILQEAGKDRRAAMFQDARATNGFGNRYTSRRQNGNIPATTKQKNALNNFGIDFKDDITKADASELLDKAFEQLNNGHNDD
jgi:hypothetical protein